MPEYLQGFCLCAVNKDKISKRHRLGYKMEVCEDSGLFPNMVVHAHQCSIKRDNDSMKALMILIVFFFFSNSNLISSYAIDATVAVLLECSGRVDFM